MTFYASLILLSELLMLAMTLHVLCYSGFTRSQKAWYLATFVAIMLCAAAEFAVHCGTYDPRFALPLTALTVAQFTLAPMLALLFIGALGVNSNKKIVIAFFLANLLIEVISAPNGWIFYFGEAGYFRGDFFIVYEALYILSMLYLIIGMIIVGKRFQHRDVWTIVMVLVILVAGIVPMTFFKVNVTYIAIAIGATLCYIYYNDLVQQDIKAELISNQDKISGMQSHIIAGLASVIESRDLETGEHVARTSNYVKMLSGFAMQEGVYADEIDEDFISKMYMLAPMHDIGKIVVSDQILRQPRRLTNEEFEEIKKHAQAGGEIVRKVLSGVAEEDYLSFAADIATYHHERWDGNGYPKGLVGDEIPLSARIMAIADVFDALVSERCYKKAISPAEAFKIIEDESGTHFDPKLAEVFLRHKDAFERVTGLHQ